MLPGYIGPACSDEVSIDTMAHLYAENIKSNEEIAREMNLSPKIVRNYKARAINILKKDLLDKSPFLALFTLLFSK